MNFYPKGYFNKISDIPLTYLKQNCIKGLILDVDNTLIDYYKNMPQEIAQWIIQTKEEGIKMCILSNSNNQEKIKQVAEKLELEYSYFAMKPFKKGFKKAQKILDLPNTEIAVIGDQIFTDVIGANRMGMYSILVNPIQEKDIFLTSIKRPVENYVKQNFLKMQSQEKDNNKKCANIEPQRFNNLKEEAIINIEKKNNNQIKNTLEQQSKEERDVF